MPATTAMVVDPRRDHSFRIPRPDLTRKTGAPNACNRCHDDRSVAWAEETVARWYPELAARPHYGQAFHAARLDLAGADQLLGRVADDPLAPAIVRATGLALLRERLTPASLPRIERGLVDPEPLVRMGAIEAAEGLEPVRLAALLPGLLRDPIRTLRIDAGFALAGDAESYLTPDQKTELEQALDEYRAAQAAQAEVAESWVNLGTLAAKRGDVTGAEAHYNEAIRREPSFIPAYVNLADAYRGAGREADGEGVLRDALARAPESPEVHYALGLLLSRTGRTAAAMDELERASRAAPGNALFSYAYGVALHSVGDAARALSVLAAAHAKHPGDAEILIAMATIARDAGRRADARGYARQLVALRPGDAQAQQLLAELEGPGSPESEPR